MRDKITITVTDPHGSKHYTVNQIVKKIALYVFLGILALFLIAASIIFFLDHQANQLNRHIDALKTKSENEELRYAQLHKENRNLYKEISRKSEALDSMADKIDDIEMRIGLKPVPDMDVETRINIAALDTANRMLILQMIPNGYPLEYKGITGKFGWRKHPILGNREFHSGIDLKAAMNTPVYAPADGVVEYAGDHKASGYGKLLILSHNYGFKTYYGHLNSLKVKIGDCVKKGELVALTGNTGLSNGPHLHYEIRYLQMKLNPQNFMVWDVTNFKAIFEKEHRVKWDSLVKMITGLSGRLCPPQTPPAPPSSLPEHTSSAN